MDNEELNEVYLGFVRLIGEENDGYYRYEFIFTDNIDEFWGENFEYKWGYFFEIINIYI